MSPPQSDPIPDYDFSKPIVRIYVDNSNAWILGQRTYARKQQLCVDLDPTWRLNMDALLAELLRPFGDLPPSNINMTLYGSRSPASGPLWKAVENMNIKTVVLDRNRNTGKEKAVDTSLVGGLCKVMGGDVYLRRNWGAFIHYVVVSGDEDIVNPAMTYAKEDGFPLHMWAWDVGMCRSLRNARSGEDGLTVHYLDEAIDTIGYNSRLFLPSKARPIHPMSIVILEPTVARFKDISRVEPVFRIPWREHRIGNDLVIIPVGTRHIKKADLDNFSYKSKHNPILTQQMRLRIMTYAEYQSGYRLVEAYSHYDYYDDEGAEETTDTTRRTSDSKLKRCGWKSHCQYGLQCKYDHSDEENERFYMFGIESPSSGLYLCKYGRNCRNPDQCRFAHGQHELFCPTCDRYGHEMMQCPEK